MFLNVKEIDYHDEIKHKYTFTHNPAAVNDYAENKTNKTYKCTIASTLRNCVNVKMQAMKGRKILGSIGDLL
jgi:hypothetical protein